MRNEKIIQAIAAYLGKVMTYNNSLTKIQFERTCVNGAAEFIEQEATYIAAAIAPHLEAGAGEQVKDLQVGAHVKIIAKIETGDRSSHRFQIGHIGTITRVDLSDPLYQYLIDDHDFGWVLADEIELIG